MAATLFAVSNPEEPRSGIVTIEEAMEEYNEMMALHPDWFTKGLGWETVIDEEKGDDDASASL